MSTGGMMGGGTTQASVSFYIMLNEKMEHTSTWVADKINDVCKDLKRSCDRCWIFYRRFYYCPWRLRRVHQRIQR